MVSIGNQGGCEEVCKVLRKCAEFGSACPRVQLWALGCAANLLASSDNRRALLLGRGEGADSALREEGEELLESGVGENAAVWEEGEEAAEKGGGGGEAEVGMAGWIHTLFANSDRVSKDRWAGVFSAGITLCPVHVTVCVCILFMRWNR